MEKQAIKTDVALFGAASVLLLRMVDELFILSFTGSRLSTGIPELIEYTCTSFVPPIRFPQGILWVALSKKKSPHKP